MQKLHLVGFTTDQKGLILSARRGARSGSYHLTLDDALAEAVEELRARQAEADEVEAVEEEGRTARVESALPVREIQARLRQGRTVEDVAKAAGVEPAWVERFAPPVFAEQAQIIATVRGMPLQRARLGPSTHAIGDAVRRNLVERGVAMTPDEHAAAWTTRQMADGRWAVRFAFRHRNKNQTLRFDYDDRSRTVAAADRLSGQLGYVAPPPGSRPAPPRPKPSPTPTARPTAKRATVTTGYRPEPAAKPQSRPGKERERANEAMRRAAAQRATEAERTAARKAKEKAARDVRQAKAAKAEEARRAREQAAAERAKAAAARKKAAAAKKKEAERARQKAAKQAAAQARRAEAALAAAERAAAKKAAAKETTAKKTTAKKGAATKAAAKPAAANSAAAKNAPREKAPGRRAPAKRAAAKKSPAKKTAASEQAVTKKAPAKKAPAKAEPAKAEPAKAEPAKAEPAKAEPAKRAPRKTAPANEAPVQQTPPRQAAPTTPIGEAATAKAAVAPSPVDTRAARVPLPRFGERGSSAPASTSSPSGTTTPAAASRPARPLGTAPTPPGPLAMVTLEDLGADVSRPVAQRPRFRPGLAEPVERAPEADEPQPNGQAPPPIDRPRRTRPLRAT